VFCALNKLAPCVQVSTQQQKDEESNGWTITVTERPDGGAQFEIPTDWRDVRSIAFAK